MSAWRNGFAEPTPTWRGATALTVKETLPEPVEGAALSPSMTVREPRKGGDAKAWAVGLAKE